MTSECLAPIPSSASLSASSNAVLEQVRAFEELVLKLPQVAIKTEHVLHGGMYARTIRIPAGIVMTGALVKIPTVLIVNGVVDVLTGESWTHLSGYRVLMGAALRKQVFVTRSAVEMTMVFPTQTVSVEEAEREFTDEFERLMSRRG